MQTKILDGIRRFLFFSRPAVFFYTDTNFKKILLFQLKQYFCFEAAKPTSRERVACEACGEFFANEAALAGHKAASICGIGVGPSSNGRRMFWCRLCNYASCEKSTILRYAKVFNIQDWITYNDV